MSADLGRMRRLGLRWLRSRADREAVFDLDWGTLTVAAYAPGVLRLRFEGPATDAPPRHDYDLIAAPPGGEAWDLVEKDGLYRFESGGLCLDISRNPFGLRLIRDGRALLETTCDGHISGGLRIPSLAIYERSGEGAWWIAFGLRSGEAVYGLGEKFGRLDRRGQLVISWNEDALGVNSEPSYKNVPFAWSTEGWGLFVHTTARVSHGVGYPQWSARSYALRVEEPVLDLFLLVGDSPGALLERYTHLTGRTPLLPRWSYGVWMSRCYYATADEALAAARGLRERSIPCDVITLDGRAWLKVETRFGFEWDRDRYPDPRGFARMLRDLDFRLCVWEYPYISVHNPLFAELAGKGYLLRTPSGGPYIYQWDPGPFGVILTPLPPSGIVDFTNPEAYAWFRDAHRPLFEAGVDVIKSDFGEQVPPEALAASGDDGRRLHNVYPLLFNRCVYEATARHSHGGAIVWGRSGWTGSQRYPIQWGGDPQADWEGLAASIRGGLSWCMSGAAFYAHDIGGFYHLKPGMMPDAELYVRWAQAGVMSSHTRFHGTSPREPWYYGDEAEEIVRRWLLWRYRLIPYLEAAAYEAHRTGMPVMRAMPLAFPGDLAAQAFEHQYMLGPALLVAPVLGPGGGVQVYLPAGGWYDVESGERQEGPRVLDLKMPLDRIPIYGREGQVLPLGPAVRHTGELEMGTHLEEMWVFGDPWCSVEWPDLAIGADDMRQGRLPAGLKLRRLGVSSA